MGRIQRILPEGAPRRVAVDLRLLRDIFQSKYENILDLHPWSFLHVWAAVQVPADYATGTITLTQGSATVTGAGTAWTSSHVGLYLLAAGEVPLKVTAVASGTSLTIEAPWGQGAGTAIAYKLRKLDLSTGNAEAHSIYRVWWKTRPLGEKTLDFIDSYDPDRDSTGDPLIYATRGFSVTNGMMFEIHPYATGMVRTLALRKPALPALDGEVVFPNIYVLELALKMGAFEYAYSETGARHWAEMSQLLGQEYSRSLIALIEEDRVASSWPQSVPNAEEPDVSMLDPLTHDVMPL